MHRPDGDQAEAALGKTWAAVITFQPDLEVLDRQFAAMAQQGPGVVVVDNHSPNREQVGALARAYGFDFVLLPENRGVAAAQNAAVESVRAKGGLYLVFMDQDSIPEPGAFGKLVAAYLSLAARYRVAAVGSSYTLQSGYRGSSFVRFGWFRFRKLYCDDVDGAPREVDFLISSGTLIPCSVIDEVGPMKEELFIDHVDTEWFLRAKSKGYRSFGCCAARMEHALGERTVRFWFGRWRTVPIHRGFRYFFIFRNSLWLYRQSYAPAKWISADLVRLVYIFVFTGILASGRAGNFRWMSKGLRAGLSAPGRWNSAEVVARATATRPAQVSAEVPDGG